MQEGISTGTWHRPDSTIVLDRPDRLAAGIRTWVQRAIGVGLAFACAAFALSQERDVPRIGSFAQKEILKALVPDDASTRIDEEYGGGVRSVLEIEKTDFGLSAREFLVAVVYWVETFPCASCRHSRLGVFDLSSRALIWQLDSPPAISVEDQGEGYPHSLRFFRVTGADSVLTLAYTHFADNCLQCGGNEETEVWLQPELSHSGQIRSFHTIWQGMVGSGNNGNRGGTPYSACGQMIKKSDLQYEYLARIFVGLPAKYPSYSSGEPPSCQELSPERPVEFRRTEAWLMDTPGMPLRRISMSAPVRVDHYKADSFPLSLPVRALDWHRTSSIRNNGGNLSPNGQWVVDRKSKEPRAPFSSDRYWPRLELRKARGGHEPIRVVRLEKLDAYDLNSIALGWSSDSSRFFVVAGGLTEWPCLLSFSVEGEDDYWEKLLTDNPKQWRDGFVLVPVVSSGANHS